MSLPREPANISDLERDAERYRQLVRMLRITRQQLDKLEAENPDIDLILDRLLPRLDRSVGRRARLCREAAAGSERRSILSGHPCVPSTRTGWHTDTLECLVGGPGQDRTGVFAGPAGA